MNSTFKKLAAVLSAAAIAVTMSGCGDNGYIMTVDGMPIRNGVYLSMQQTSFSNAQSRLDELDDDSDSSNSTDSNTLAVDVTERMIDGKTYSQWVKDNTLKGVKRFVGIQRLCKEFGIELSDDELSDVNKSVQDDWDYENYYLQFISSDFKIMGDYYESLGIGIDSMKEIEITNVLNEKLFLHYYGEGGEYAVSDEEINKYMTDNNAAYKLITLPYQDYNGDPLVSDEEKQEVKDRAKSYADSYNEGAKFIDILYEFDLKTAQDKARKEAEASYTEDNEDKLTKEEYVQKAIDAAAAEKGSSDDLYDEVISKDSTLLSEELVDYIFNAKADDTATVFEGTTSAYVVIRKSVLDLNDWRDQHLTDTIRELKNDDFNSMMDLLCQNYSVEQNDYLVDKKYSPEKMRK